MYRDADAYAPSNYGGSHAGYEGHYDPYYNNGQNGNGHDDYYAYDDQYAHAPYGQQYQQPYQQQQQRPPQQRRKQPAKGGGFLCCFKPAEPKEEPQDKYRADGASLAVRCCAFLSRRPDGLGTCHLRARVQTHLGKFETQVFATTVVGLCRAQTHPPAAAQTKTSPRRSTLSTSLGRPWRRTLRSSSPRPAKQTPTGARWATALPPRRRADSEEQAASQSAACTRD